MTKTDIPSSIGRSGANNLAAIRDKDTREPSVICLTLPRGPGFEHGPTDRLFASRARGRCRGLVFRRHTRAGPTVARVAAAVIRSRERARGIWVFRHLRPRGLLAPCLSSLRIFAPLPLQSQAECQAVQSNPVTIKSQEGNFDTAR
jgi:hypothetical protein